jgi:hypothetical protein
VVLAEVVLGNIPVKNGVVHLIHRPLMVVDTTVAKFLEVRTCCCAPAGIDHTQSIYFPSNTTTTTARE